MNIHEGKLKVSNLQQEHPLFMQLDKSIIRDIMYEADISILKPGEYLYKGGNTAPEFYIILYGRVLFTDE